MLRVPDLGAQTDTTHLVTAPSTATSTSFLMTARRGVPSVVLVLLASAVITVCFLSVLPERFRLNEETDFFTSYEPAARNFVAGRGFLRSDGSFSTSHPPGYPLILAGIFSVSKLLGVSEDVALSAFAITCMAVVSLFVFLLARMFWGVRPALISSLVWMTYPFGLWLTKQPDSELPFMVVLYGGLCLFWYALSRRLPAQVHFLCGLILGAAMLIRPIAMGVGLVLSAIVWFARRDLGRRARGLLIATLLLGNLVAVSPWEAWVYHKNGQVILLSTNGVKSIRDGLTYAVETKGYRQPDNAPPDAVQVMEDISLHRDEISNFGSLGSIMFREFRSHPAGVTKLLLLKLARSWYGTDSRRFETTVLLIQLAYLLLVAWGARCAWKSGGRHRGLMIGVLLLTGYFWGMTFLALSILRYMVPIIGLLFVLIAGSFPGKPRTETKPAFA